MSLKSLAKRHMTYLVPLLYSVRRTLFAQPVKKFYKNVSISQAGKEKNSGSSMFEVQLDQRKLKTPGGHEFLVPSEMLALAVAQEWDSQKDTIKRYAMHLTTLCNRVIDWNLKPDSIVQGMMQYSDTDTICFRCSDPDDLLELQRTAWDPVLNWVKDRYQIQPMITHSLTSTVRMSPEDRETLSRHFHAYSRWGLIGLQSCVENLKSVFLTLATTDGFCSATRAVDLSCLEQTFQIQRWGEVPSHHDVELTEMKARVTAAVFLVLCTHQEKLVKQKLPGTGYPP